MKTDKQKGKSRVVHQIAYCHDCGWEHQDYLNQAARKAAYRHAKKTGHRVTGETGTSWNYN